MTFSRRTVSKAKPENLIRLAKYLNIDTKDNCICNTCNALLVESVVRNLDKEESWPPKLLERKW